MDGDKIYIKLEIVAYVEICNFIVQTNSFEVILRFK
jgi:hypothetical protein